MDNFLACREIRDGLPLHGSRLGIGLVIHQLVENPPVIFAVRLPAHHRLAPSSPQLIEAGVDGDACQPGGEGGAAVEIGDLGEGLDQAVLGHRVSLRDADILSAHHPHTPLMAVDELAEGVVVAVLSPQHQRVVRLGKIASRRVHGLCSQHIPLTINVFRG